jgi:IS5 family transposase
MDPKSLFRLNDHLEMLSRHGDPLEVLERTVDFEYFRAWLVERLGYGDGSKGGRPPFDPIAMSRFCFCRPSIICPMPEWSI